MPIYGNPNEYMLGRPQDERWLSRWMREHVVVSVWIHEEQHPYISYGEWEKELLGYWTPPLKWDKNPRNPMLRELKRLRGRGANQARLRGQTT